MVKLVISLGSNSHDRQCQMDFAIRHLKSILKNVLVSSIYETPAINGKDAPYFNAVAFAAGFLTVNVEVAIVVVIKIVSTICDVPVALPTTL